MMGIGWIFGSVWSNWAFNAKRTSWTMRANSNPIPIGPKTRFFLFPAESCRSQPEALRDTCSAVRRLGPQQTFGPE